ncbi:MAG: hypothetical protein K2P06_01985, partial [Muribaculaceae bacterium]|nr:hypothetical protein [Muribaculaceae bacterium]
YIYHVGQYLPEWHPWENYQDFFVGDKRTNGCREIMAIEFPWLIETFGEIREVSVLHDKMSHLNIDYLLPERLNRLQQYQVESLFMC